MTATIEDAVAKAIEENSSLVKKSSDEFLEDMKKSDKDIKNKVESKKISLGDLGKFEKVGSDEVEALFDKIDGFVFKIGKCLFKISYINRGGRKFTAELLNELKA